MIPRIEQKLEFSKFQYIDFLKWLKLKNALILYPERRICSRYLDNKNMEMFNDTVEGLVPRKKIRVRTYETENFLKSRLPYSLEVKITTENKRMKYIVKNFDFQEVLENGFYDKHYGICFDKVDIIYTREYFLINDMRVTIDRDIKYKKINPSGSVSSEFKENSYVLEIKTDINKNLSDISNFFDFPRTRFSKYEKAIESVNNI